MKQMAHFSIILLGVIYGAAFSFCTLVTLGDLFYRKVKRVILFPIIAGAIFGIVEFLQNRFIGGINMMPLYLFCKNSTMPNIAPAIIGNRITRLTFL